MLNGRCGLELRVRIRIRVREKQNTNIWKKQLWVEIEIQNEIFTGNNENG